jgi:hypothetical protein
LLPSESGGTPEGSSSRGKGCGVIGVDLHR